jgi:hypothetical protein
LPHEVEESWFIDVFDWDTISVDAVGPTRSSISLNLCGGILPCYINIQGRQSTLIQGRQSTLILQSELGFISCSVGSGCSGIKIHSIKFGCSRDVVRGPVFKIQGSSITIANSQFSNCTFEQDGGVVQSFGDLTVVIESGTFQNISSLGYGGVVSAF